MQESMDRVFEIVAVVVEVLGAGILLGLEVLVAADLVRTITSKPSLEDALILGAHRCHPDGPEHVHSDRDRGCPALAPCPHDERRAGARRSGQISTSPSARRPRGRS